MCLAAPRSAAGTRRGVELADIFRAHGPAYRRDHRLSPQPARVMDAIEACRTAQLGGHRESCENCGFERFAYNSCRNRHCPKCQSLAKAQWLQQRQAELLPVPYFHVVLTLPHELNRLILANKRLMLNLLFQAGARTLLQFGHNNLGGTIGFTMILHTWDQQLRPHFHLHCLVPSGALAADRDRWIHGDPKFLFSVHALGKVFRGKFLDGLRRLWNGGRLVSGTDELEPLCAALRTKPWVVYAKTPFAGAEQVLDYLGRYTHRIAISNDRILALRDGTVTFAYRDRAAGDVHRTTTLPAERFIGRFLQHVLPRGFVRIRHFGYLANRCKVEALARCRDLLGATPPSPPEPKSAVEWVLLLTGKDLTRCPRCGHSPLIYVEIEPARYARARAPPEILLNPP
jgi:hypothetical protein